ncbi:TBC1 domain family member 13 [Fasciolopsis buskii]|uniref:TBC1 domain family member 13 n=1 Tax=Fasciolopsis buskii TaxID=27845 RepID=A0A8E0RWH2_9TREM|nr:TBC1 domain family member 13 [Fasciolopsis buski]
MGPSSLPKRVVHSIMNCRSNRTDEVKQKTEAFVELLQSESIRTGELRRLCIHGCPDSLGIRSTCWKLLLNYLPPHRDARSAKLSSCRVEYASYVDDFVIETGTTESSDHPLSSSPGGDWITYFNDNRVLLQINRDCRRLCPDFDFFHRVTDFPGFKLFGRNCSVGILRRRIESSFLQVLSRFSVFELCHAVNRNLVGVVNMIDMPKYDPFLPMNSLSSGLAESCTLSTTLEDGNNAGGPDPGSVGNDRSAKTPSAEEHWEVIERILFIYYKTHTGQGYVQGMNELIAPIYFVFATDPDEQCRQWAEADTFYCFNNLMTEVHPNFIRNLDGGQVQGIGGQIRLLIDLLGRTDPHLLEHLSRLGLEPEHYAFRWLSLLLAREFVLPDVIRLWDTLFSDEHRFAMVPFVCCAMLVLIRDQLLAADFPNAVHLVQHYPPTIPLISVLSKAQALYVKCIK